MAKLFAFILIIAVSPAILFSQDDKETSVISLKGKKAILFSFNGFNLNSYNGGVGWKKWTSDNTAIIWKFVAAHQKDKKEESRSLPGIESGESSYEITFGFEKHLKNLSRKLSPYLGGQLGIGYAKTENKLIGSRYNENEIKEKTLSYSLQALFGVEYFLSQKISLSGQYNLGGYYTYGNEQVNSSVVDDSQKVSKFHFGVWASSITLSIYL